MLFQVEPCVVGNTDLCLKSAVLIFGKRLRDINQMCFTLAHSLP